MTSIEWLEKELLNRGVRIYQNSLHRELFQKAKEMHKKETIKFGYDCFASIDNNEECIYNKLPEELYKETFYDTTSKSR